MTASENGTGNRLGPFSWSNSEAPFHEHTSSFLRGLATLTKEKDLLFHAVHETCTVSQTHLNVTLTVPCKHSLHNVLQSCGNTLPVLSNHFKTRRKQVLQHMGTTQVHVNISNISAITPSTAAQGEFPERQGFSPSMLTTPMPPEPPLRECCSSL